MSITTTPGMTGPYLDQQLHVLVDEDMRAFTLGLAEINARGTGRPPKEGDAVRGLLADAIARTAKDAPKFYAEALELGQKELAKRAKAKEKPQE